MKEKDMGSTSEWANCKSNESGKQQQLPKMKCEEHGLKNGGSRQGCQNAVS